MANSLNSTSALPQGGHFLNHTHLNCFAPENFSADEQLMIAAAKDFSVGEILPLADRLDHKEPGLMQSLIRKAGDLGFCGPDTPEQYGGLGLTKNLAARMLEFLSLNASFSVTIGITSGIGQLGLVLFGSEEQKTRFLPDLANGQKIAAYALSEPNSGSDAMSLSTRADLRGGHYVLNGTKMWISNAQWADMFLTLAKVDGDKLTAFLVERNLPGVTVSREEHKMGLKGSSTARLVLENAEVPTGNVLYEIGNGHHVAFNALNLGRFKLASMSIGPARDAIRLASQYASERKQFGQQISNFGLIKKKFMVMMSLFYAAESMAYRTGALIDHAFANHGGTIRGNRTAAEEYAIECSMTKVFATEAEALIIDEALQCYGGYGFTEEFPIARHYRDARVSRIYEGTNEINRIFIADRLLRKIEDGSLKLPDPESGFISSLLYKLLRRNLETQIEKGALAEMAIFFYAQQGAASRAKQLGGLAVDLSNSFEAFSNLKAAESYQTATGDSVSLPSVSKFNFDEVASYLLRTNAPFLGNSS